MVVDFDWLRERIAGPVLEPNDGGFAEEVAAWSQTYVHRPAVAVGATSTSDIVTAVRFAAENDLAVRVQATGHGSHSAITDGMLITTRRLDSLSIDSHSRTATIGAGTVWAPVIAAAAELGLAPIAGSSPTVGAVGYLMGGGLGPLARSHGFSSDFVREFEVVLADGQIVRASSDQHPDLFWALRGGKGGLGVVTQVTIELVELVTLYGGSLVYDTPDIETALRAWVDFTETADPDVTTSIAILRTPDLPVVPEPLRGRTVLALRFAYPGDAATGEKLAAPLRAAAPVYIDALGEIPAAAIASIHNDPTNPQPTLGYGRMLNSIDQDFATALLGAVGPEVKIPLVAIEIRHLGARAAHDVASGSAVGGRSPGFTLNLLGVPNPELFETVLPDVIQLVASQLDPWLADETTINFAPSYHPAEPAVAAWSVPILNRLTTVRAIYDPRGIFAYGGA